VSEQHRISVLDDLATILISVVEDASTLTNLIPTIDSKALRHRLANIPKDREAFKHLPIVTAWIDHEEAAISKELFSREGRTNSPLN
jgi:hypothetical protein